MSTHYQIDKKTGVLQAKAKTKAQMAKQMDMSRPDFDFEQPINQYEVRNFRPDRQYKHPVDPPKINMDTTGLIIIDGLPITSNAAKQKEQIKDRLLLKKCEVKRSRNIFIPVSEETGKTMGFAFVEVKDKTVARHVAKTLSGYSIKKKELTVNLWADLEKYRHINEDDYKVEEVPFKERKNIYGWLKNPYMDQYLLQLDGETQVLWNDILREGDVVVSRKKWTDAGVGWSPRGSYMVTSHKQGFALWAGDDFKEKITFPHKFPSHFEFSPKETYMFTVNEDQTNNCILWDVRNGQKIMTLTVTQKSIDNLQAGCIWKWSPDEKYFGRHPKDADGILIYDTINFKLVGKKIVVIKGVENFQFSPATHNGKGLISYWVPDSDNTPAQVALMEIPSLKVVGRKNFFDVKNILMQFNHNGEFLVAKVDRDQKVKREDSDTYETRTITTFEIFNVGQKGMPVQSIKFSGQVRDFGWEPEGKKFALILNVNEEGTETEVMIYHYTKGKFDLQKKLPNEQSNKLLWGSRGRFLVLGHTKTMNTALQFWDMDKKELLGKGEHYKMSGIEWDPTGRYLVTYVDAKHRSGNNGFIIWSMLGDKLYEKEFPNGLVSFKWRPRPPSFLTKDEKKKVKKQLPSRIKRYRKEEEERMLQEHGKELEKYTKLWKVWNQNNQFIYQSRQQEKKARADWRGYETEEDEEDVVVEYEWQIEEEEEI